MVSSSTRFSTVISPRSMSWTVIEPSLGILKRMTCRSPRLHTGGSLAGIQVAAGAIVKRRELELVLLLAQLFQPLGRAEAVIGMAALDQLAGILLVDLFALGLVIGGIWPADAGTFVPFQAQPVQAVDQLFFCAGHVALLVGVFDAQDELPPVWRANR